MQLSRPDYSSFTKEELIERIRQLEEAAPGIYLNPKLKVGKSVETLILFLYENSLMSREVMYARLYGMSEDPPDDKILDTWVFKVRAKLREFGIEVKTSWGRGWYLTSEDKVKLQQYLVVPMEPAK